MKAQNQREFEESKNQLEMEMEMDRQKQLSSFQDKLYKENGQLDENMLPVRRRPERLLKLTPNLKQAPIYQKKEKTEAELRMEKIDAEVNSYLNKQKAKSKLNQDI